QAANEVRIKPIAAGDFLRGFPAKTPGHEDALTGVALQDPLHRRGDGMIVSRQICHGLAIAGVKSLGSPGEGLVEMAKVAGIRTSISSTFPHGRRRDLMATHRVQ